MNVQKTIKISRRKADKPTHSDPWN